MRLVIITILMVLSGAAWGQDRSPLMPELDSLFLRVIDTGSGTATLMIVTGDTNRKKRVMVYDGGHWNDDPLIIDELQHYLARKRVIDLLIVSHSDSDHLGAADSVLEFWAVQRSVRTGWERDIGTYESFRDMLEWSVANKGTEDFIIGDGDPSLGETWALGDADVTFLSGFSELPDGWDVGVSSGNSRFESKSRNAVSIVVRVDYADTSILFAGDAVGRADEAPWDQLIATERFLVENADISADILLAPHHGADNASSLPFIQAVGPSWTIFSAGNLHKHPKFNTFRRYESVGVPVEQMLRTDRGDMRGRETEWWGDWDESCRDTHGDDGISILIRDNGEIVVDQDPVADPALGC